MCLSIISLLNDYMIDCRASSARATPVSSFFRGEYKGYFLSFVTVVTEFVQVGHLRYVVCTLGMICFI